MSISWGTDCRYAVQEHSVMAPGEWYRVDRFADVEDAFETVRDQQLLMVKGRMKYPDKAEAYDRTYRVVDTRRNKVILWPAPDYQLPPPPRPRSPDHMMDALAYVTQGQQISGLRTAHSPSTI